MTMLQPKPVRLEGDRSHGEDWETFTFPMASAAPPAHGGGAASADATAAISGGADGFFLSRTAWDVIAGQGLMLTPLREQLEDLDENPALRSAATLRAMDRLRDALEQVSEASELDTPVALTLGDAALLMRQLISRLR